MSISLVITVKNEATSALELIQDIQAQTQQPDEWIVVDGGSTDNTADLFERAHGCRVIRQPGNIAQGRNCGVELAAGTLIVMTDAGCRLPATWLETLVAPFAQSGSDAPIDVVGGRFRGQLDNSFHAVQWSLLDQLNFGADRQRSPRFSCRSLAFRRRVWSACQFPEWLDHGEDAWIQTQWQRLGFKIRAADAPAVSWQLRPSLGSFFLQHVRYARADGKARMRRQTNVLRLSFYTFALLLVLSGLYVDSRPLLLSSPGLWATYLALNGGRLLQVLWREERMRWSLLSLALLAPMLAALDLAKIGGFLTGLAARHRETTAPTAPVGSS